MAGRSFSRILESGLASAVKTRQMGVRVDVADGESLQGALIKLRKGVDLQCRRSWYKKRFGYYEKRSIRRRRKRKLQDRNEQLIQHFGATGGIRMYLGLRALCRRE